MNVELTFYDITATTPNCNDAKPYLICFDLPCQADQSSYSCQTHSPPWSPQCVPWRLCQCVSLLHPYSHLHLESHPGEAIAPVASVGGQLETNTSLGSLTLGFNTIQIIAVSVSLEINGLHLLWLIFFVTHISMAIKIQKPVQNILQYMNEAHV